MIYLGIDIGGTSVKYGLVTTAGEILKKAEYPVAFDSYHTPILDTVLKTSQAFLKNNLEEEQRIEGIGVSATGQIDVLNGLVAGVGGNISNWKGARIKDELESLYQVPVTVINDANCAALAEKWIGNAKDYHHAVVVTIGTGVGGGIIINDQILLGASGYAGELGHFSIEKSGKTCTCQNKGCFEQYASMTALIKMVRESVSLDHYPNLQPEDINGRVIFELVKNQDQAVIDLVEEWILNIATGLVSLVHIFNPEIILLGGGVSHQEELFIKKVRSLVKKHAMENFKRDLKIEKAALGNDAGMVGAVYYLIQQNGIV